MGNKLFPSTVVYYVNKVNGAAGCIQLLVSYPFTHAIDPLYFAMRMTNLVGNTLQYSIISSLSLLHANSIIFRGLDLNRI